MLKIENTEVLGWEHAIRGMRNPMNSWAKSDSEVSVCECERWPHDVKKSFACLGSNDLDLMKRLRNAGTDHRKFMRMITVYVDLIGPLYWWKEFDTYKVWVRWPIPALLCIKSRRKSSRRKISAVNIYSDRMTCSNGTNEKILRETTL